MSSITQTEFNRNPSEAAKAARRDGIVVITNRGVPAFDLVPHRDDRLTPRERSVADGVTIPASAGPLIDTSVFRPVLASAGISIDELIAEVGGDY